MFNYKKVAKEIGWNFAKINPLVEHSSSYDYYTEVVKNINPNTKMLDIGCGSAEKAIRFYSLANKVYELDHEEEMLKKAQKNVKKYYEDIPKIKDKFSFFKADSDNSLPFENETFDLVVSRHCGANMNEVYRVLKKGGIFISEDVSNDDCQELKDFFKRGQDYNEEPLYKKVMNNCIELGFQKIEFLRFEEIEYYKNEVELKYLLSHTPILNGFDEEKDNGKLQEYISKFKTNKGIQLNRRLYAFKLIK